MKARVERTVKLQPERRFLNRRLLDLTSTGLRKAVRGLTRESCDSTDERHPQLSISREIIIKRVANILGASHPQGTEEADNNENKFDSYVKELHQIELADGYPATYYQLLEIAKNILYEAKKLLKGVITINSMF